MNKVVDILPYIEAQRQRGLDDYIDNIAEGQTSFTFKGMMKSLGYGAEQKRKRKRDIEEVLDQYFGPEPDAS